MARQSSKKKQHAGKDRTGRSRKASSQSAAAKPTWPRACAEKATAKMADGAYRLTDAKCSAATWRAWRSEVSSFCLEFLQRQAERVGQRTLRPV
jgi:hypothetical protein